MRTRPLLDDLTEALTGIFDLERHYDARGVRHAVNGKDLRALWSTADALAAAERRVLRRFKAAMLREIRQPTSICCPIFASSLTAPLSEEPPAPIREGGMIREGYQRGA